NRIRHELLPLLRKKYQQGLDRNILRTMEIVEAEAEFVRDIARQWMEERFKHQTANFKFQISNFKKEILSTELPFGKLPIAVQRRCLQLQLMRLGVEPDFRLIEQLRTHVEKPITVLHPQAAEKGIRYAVCGEEGIVRLEQGQREQFKSGS